MPDLGPIPPDLAADLVEQVGPLVTYCRIFAVGPACATPCDDCRRASRDVHRAIGRGEHPDTDPRR